MQLPSTGDQIDLNKVNGSLLYITCRELQENVATTFGPTDAVLADVAILDGEDKGTVLQDVMFFPRVLVRQLKRAVGSVDPTVLGRLGQGEAKKGQDPPWILEVPDEAELAIGVKYEAYVAKEAAKKAAPVYGDEEPFLSLGDDRFTGDGYRNQVAP